MLKESFSYLLSFFIVVIVAVFALSYTGEKDRMDHYVNIEVTEGDSIWSIADQFKEHHNLSKSDFVEWVQEKNGMETAVIKPGEQVFIPIEKTAYYEVNQIASKK
jgi:cell division protein YceG involved in septum cleavage